jgi:hypothetical protein
VKFTDRERINQGAVIKVMKDAWWAKDVIDGIKWAPFEMYYETDRLFINMNSCTSIGVQVKLPNGSRLLACSCLGKGEWRHDGPWIDEFERVMHELENDPRVKDAVATHEAAEKAEEEKAKAEQKRKLDAARGVFANSPLTTLEKENIYGLLAKRVTCWESSWGEVVSGLYEWDHERGGPGVNINEHHEIFQAVDKILAERK